MTTVRITLGPKALEVLGRPVVGQGGFQTLLRQMQAAVQGRDLSLTPDQVAKVVRYVEKYGQGGFQGRLDTVLAELRRLASVLRPLTELR
ncbi:MAG: hypothetical protein A3I61_14605 [Acidobacteria bacterium RIFCSPLOWO2_02_FULL_68_18]|nr:MAG: hypothetical protein A3I61_14605 [Acidobacteria bacterium RIFCSPLOWO2_02_FULL_68_18]OFW52201.1 MAG: hypothetical protein A3G77_08305 [Acidobacteria bacterium RIFCSPLOWO2_12_FULL_68_19]